MLKERIKYKDIRELIQKKEFEKVEKLMISDSEGYLSNWLYMNIPTEEEFDDLFYIYENYYTFENMVQYKKIDSKGVESWYCRGVERKGVANG